MGRCKSGTAKKCKTVCSLPCDSSNSKAKRSSIPKSTRKKKARRVVPTMISRGKKKKPRRVTTTMVRPSNTGNLMQSNKRQIGDGQRRFYANVGRELQQYIGKGERYPDPGEAPFKNRK